MKAADDFNQKLDAIRRDLHDIVLAAERASEGLHAARAGRSIAEAATAGEVGEIFVRHCQCCWDRDMDEAARVRLREISRAEAMTPEVPF